MSTTSRKSKVVAALVAASFGVGALGLSQATMTSAAVSEAVSATSGHLATAADLLPPPTTVSCADTIRDGNHLGLPNYWFRISVTHLNAAFDYRVYVVQVDNNIPYTYTVDASSASVGSIVSFPVISGNSSGMSHETAWTYYARVYSVNRATGEMSENWKGYETYQPTIYRINCVGDKSGVGYPPGYVPPGAGRPGSPMFTTLMDTLNSEEMLEPLSEDTELADLDAAAAKPAPTSEAKPTESETGTTGPSPTSPSAEAAPSTEAEDGSTESSTSSSTSTAPSTPRTSTRGTAPAATSISSQAVPTTPKTTVSATRTSTADPQPTTAPPATTTAPTVRAGVGDDPIAVGTNFARLDEADGQPQLVITTAGGAQVCTADLPGATRITSAAGKLTVTVDGRTHSVDTGTCAID